MEQYKYCTNVIFFTIGNDPVTITCNSRDIIFGGNVKMRPIQIANHHKNLATTYQQFLVHALRHSNMNNN